MKWTAFLKEILVKIYFRDGKVQLHGNAGQSSQGKRQKPFIEFGLLPELLFSLVWTTPEAKDLYRKKYS
jgi:hypothetical protein